MMDMVEMIICVLLAFLVGLCWRISRRKDPSMFFLFDFVCYDPPFSKPNTTLALGNQPTGVYTSPNEVENIVFKMVDELFKKTKAKVEDIKVLVCVFKGSSAISLSNMIAKRYKFGSNISMYDLDGNGHDAGLVSVTLAKQLLLVNQHQGHALVVSTEDLSEVRHVSSTDGPTVLSSLPEYRLSGAAILLSDCVSDSCYSKYKFMGAYKANVAVISSSDPGRQVAITVDATSASGDRAVTTNLARLYSLFRPMENNGGYNMSLVDIMKYKWYKMWFNFNLCQVGGDLMVSERNPVVSMESLEASRRVITWFGGYIPISSLWYKLAYIEANRRRVMPGEWVSQMALWNDLSNFKGTALIWRADFRTRNALHHA